MNTTLPLLFSLILLTGCTSEKEKGLPEHVQKLENLTVYSQDVEPAFELSLERERNFGDAAGVLIGRVGSVAIDENGRVFIGDRLQYRVHVFGPDGSYLTHIGRQGLGPGEFQRVGTLSIHSNLLSVYDGGQLKLDVFKLDSLKYSHTISLNPVNQQSFEELNGLFPSEFRFRSDHRYLIGFKPFLRPDPSHPEYNLQTSTVRYHLMDTNGRIISGLIFERDNYRALTATVQGEYRFTLFEFLGVELITLSEDNDIYTARSEEFLIKVYDPNGKYLRAFYYPFQKIEFTREDAMRQQELEYEEGVVEWRISVIRNAPEKDIPKTWPALDKILIDDESRLWVSTIVEDFDVYEWWVLNDTGELMARFKWPRNRQIEVVKNDKVYVRETDPVTGLQQVVRYGFELVAR